MQGPASKIAAAHGWPGANFIAMTTLVQVDLRSANRFLTCWVEPRVKVGDQVTLKTSDEPKRRWNVLRVGLARPTGDIKRGWNNNI
jgi:hypothetical protein